MGISDIQNADRLSEIEDYLMRDQLRPSLRMSMGKAHSQSVFSHVVLTCGGLHTAILKGDGEIIVFGDNQHSQCSTAEIGRDHAVQVACGYFNTAVLMEDGSVALFGRNNHGQCTVPNLGRARVTQVACG